MRGILAFAACSMMAVATAAAQTAPTQPGQHGLFDSPPFPPEASGLVTLGDLHSRLSGYATTSALTAETTRATGAEATLQSNINTEATTRANAVALLAPSANPTFTGSATISVPGSNGLSINTTGSGNPGLYFFDNGTQSWKIAFSASAKSLYFSGYYPGSGTVFGLNADRSSIFYGPVTGVTPAAGDNSTQLTTTAGVRREIATGYTVATLPTDARRYPGARAYVTDATACTFMGALTGGGSTFCPVIYNGTTWVAE